MSVIIFIIILAVLILVHEFGHFIVAIKSGIKVSEFGIGFPPRIKKLFRWKETDFTLNWIPFGGFVKIFGENPDEESISGPDSTRSFVNKPKWIQALVLVAGVSFNIIFAWLLISAGFMSGLPTPVDYDGAGTVENARVVITSVSKDSPAQKANLKTGDIIVSVSTMSASSQAGNTTSGKNILSAPLTPKNVSDFIKNVGDTKEAKAKSDEKADAKIDIVYTRGETELHTSVTPVAGIIADYKAIGISMDLIGTLRLPFYQAFWEGAKTTVSLLRAIVVGLYGFLHDIILGRGGFSQVTGPIGIVGMVGDVSHLGFIFVLSFTAFISLNLAVINLLPFPALDGGRLLFVLIEAIRRKPISARVANTCNGIGFALLILLMVAVTVHDVIKLF